MAQKVLDRAMGFSPSDSAESEPHARMRELASEYPPAARQIILNAYKTPRSLIKQKMKYRIV